MKQYKIKDYRQWNAEAYVWLVYNQDKKETKEYRNKLLMFRLTEDIIKSLMSGDKKNIF